VPADLHSVVQAARTIAARGHLRQAAAMVDEALESTSATLGVDHPEVLAATRLLGRLYTDLGELPEARRLLEEALAAGHYRLGEDHPIMLGLAYDLALLADELGNLHEARRNYGLLARLGPGVLGPEHEYVVAARRYLGIPDDAAGTVWPPTVGEPEREQAHEPGREPAGAPAGHEPAGAPAGHAEVASVPVAEVAEAGTSGSAAAAAAASAAAVDSPTQLLKPVPWVPPPRAPQPPTPPPESAPVTGFGVPAGPPRQADRQTDPQADRQADREADRQTDRQADRQTDRRPRFDPPPPPLYDPGAPMPVERIELPPLPGGNDPLGEHHDRRSGRAPMLILVAIAVMALLGGAVAAMAAFRASGSDRTTGTTSAPAAPTSASPSPSLGTAGAPTGVQIRDQGGTVTLSWTDPASAQVPFLIAGGPGKQVRAMGSTTAGVTTYTLNGLNAKLDYCFTVGAVYGVEQVAVSDFVCTHRTVSAAPTSARPSSTG
jgi:hypothetical protein